MLDNDAKYILNKNYNVRRLASLLNDENSYVMF